MVSAYFGLPDLNHTSHTTSMIKLIQEGKKEPVTEFAEVRHVNVTNDVIPNNYYIHVTVSSFDVTGCVWTSTPLVV